MKKLDIVATIKDGIALGLVNYLSILCAAVLYLLTIWIPYLNVGTTIAMSSLPAEMAKGNVINPLFIFDGKFRRNMGEFFILMSLMTGAIGVGYLFGIIPGLVLGVAWSFAIILFVDKDRNALEALRESNSMTYGNKWRIFWAEAIPAIALCIVVSIVGALFGIGSIKALEVIGAIITVILALFFIPLIYGIEAVIYKRLALGEPETEVKVPAAPKAEKPAKAPAKKPAARKPAAKKAEK